MNLKLITKNKPMGSYLWLSTKPGFRLTIAAGKNPPAYTSPSSDPKDQIVADFVKTYPKYAGKIQTWSQFEIFLTMNKGAQFWYTTYKKDRAIVSDLPDSMREAGITAEEWALEKANLEATRAGIREYSQTVARAADEFKAKALEAEAKRDRILDQMSPLTEIAQVGQSQLPEADQLNLCLIKDPAERRAGVLKAVANFQKKLVKDFKAGEYKSPFRSK